MQRLALFDLDDTLIDRAGALRRWAAGMFEGFGVADPGAAAWLAELDDDGRADRAEVLARVIDRYGLPVQTRALLERYHAEIPSTVRAGAGVLAGLAELRAGGWRLGVVTNGPAVSQYAKMVAAGLPDLLDGWAISGAEGCGKPDRRIFEVVAARCGVDLGAGGWMVGDNPEVDIVGGRAAGLATVLIRGYGPARGADVEPDSVVDDVLEAFEIMRRDR